MTYHKDKEVNDCLVKLMDALCTWERQTGRASTLILIPHEPDERLVLARDGKPALEKYTAAFCDQVYVAAFRERRIKSIGRKG